MKVQKKFKCLHCGTIIECVLGVCQKNCKCGKVKMNGEFLIEGVLGKDVIDVSPQLLNE